jgi:hypothetical protein
MDHRKTGRFLVVEGPGSSRVFVRVVLLTVHSLPLALDPLQRLARKSSESEASTPK